jgi:hypothetical protein
LHIGVMSGGVSIIFGRMDREFCPHFKGYKTMGHVHEFECYVY